MKTAIYIDDGALQLVLTPETETDKKVLDTLEKTDSLQTYRGGFYECQGGWVRQECVDRGGLRQGYMNPKQDLADHSLIFRVNKSSEE